jgi:hypothetical protein
MGSDRNSRKEKEVNPNLIIDQDFLSFLTSFIVHIAILLTMACLYDMPNTIQKISLTLDFNSNGRDISDVDLDNPELPDFTSLIVENSVTENKEYTEEYSYQDSPPDIENSVSEAILSEPSAILSSSYDTKDLLASIQTKEYDHNKQADVFKEQDDHSPVNGTKQILEDLVKVTGNGVRFNQSQPNPFRHLSGTGSSMEARLKSAGAETGAIQISMSWDTIDDIDLHVSYTPGNGLVDNINWINRKGHISGGMLDIDMNADSNLLEHNPVENIFWPNNSNPIGYYVVKVHFYRSWTGSSRVPVLIRVKIRDKIQTFNSVAVRHLSPQKVTEFNY